MSEPAAQSISLWRQIVAAALLGSERQPNLLPETGGSLAKFVAAAQANRERTLLAAGAAVSLYNRAGRVPPRDAQSPPEPCDIEDLPRLKPRAAQQLLAVGSFKAKLDLDRSELAAWTTIASMILNLDETVTKG